MAWIAGPRMDFRVALLGLHVQHVLLLYAERTMEREGNLTRPPAGDLGAEFFVEGDPCLTLEVADGGL